MILVGLRRSEQGEDAVTGGLRDVSAIAAYRFHHQLQRWIYDVARLFRIEVLHQLHRAFDVSEQQRDCFALAVLSGIQCRRFVCTRCSGPRQEPRAGYSSRARIRMKASPASAAEATI